MRILKRGWLLAAVVALVGAVGSPAQDKVQPKQPPPDRPQLRVPEGTTVLKDLAYVPDGGPRRTLDLYLPPAEGPRPLVIWIHGGGWQAGSKDTNVRALPLLARGYAVASINYRLTQQAPFPAQIQDCKEAVRYLRSVAKDRQLDPDHFGAWGESAGGHLVALLGTLEETAFDSGPPKKLSGRVQAVCDWFGPTDFPHFFDDLDEEWKPRLRPLLTNLLGGPVEEKKDLAVSASPIAHVAKADAPFLIVHGDKDPVVPYSQSAKFYEALKKAGVDATLYKVEGGGHGLGFDKPEITRMIEAFFDKQLKKPR
jgi:acetyl esterase/lipase